MPKSAATVVTLGAAVLAVIMPVVLALHLADRQARESEMKLVTGYARDVLHRSENTASQAEAAINALAATHSPDPCSNSNLALMRSLNLSSTYLQAIGYVQNDSLLCSSQGRDAVPVGPVDWTTPNGVNIRLNVKFPFDPGTGYLIIEGRNGYAAIVNKDLPLDATTNEPDVSLAGFAPNNGRLLATRGYIDPQSVGNAIGRTFIARGHVVAVVRSSRYVVGAIAALPVSYMASQSRATARVLIPAGLIAGLVLALAAVYLGRLQTAMPVVIRAAIRRGEFRMHYQPIVDLHTHAWVGAEALIRWQRPGGEMVRPDLFIPVAEDAGMIQRITRHVLEWGRMPRICSCGARISTSRSICPRTICTPRRSSDGCRSLRGSPTPRRAISSWK